MRTVTLEETKNLLKELVSGNEDYVYEKPVVAMASGSSVQKCVNWVHDGKGGRVGSCLVGKVFEKLGVLDDTNQATTADDEAEFLAFEGVIAFDMAAVNLLREVQMQQDSRHPWGEALAVGLRKGAYDA